MRSGVTASISARSSARVSSGVPVLRLPTICEKRDRPFSPLHIIPVARLVLARWSASCDGKPFSAGLVNSPNGNHYPINSFKYAPSPLILSSSSPGPNSSSER